MKFSSRVFNCFLLLLLPFISISQEIKNSFEVYGYIMTDAGYNFNAIDPEWFDVMRPSRLPSYKDQFAPGGNVFFSVRQTRLGVRSITNTKLGLLKTQFDFDFYGFGKDAGQTTIHVVNAFAQLGKLLVGQTPSVFMDTDVFPVTLDYWGPNSRVFFLNIQIRYTPIENENNRLAIALERPGGTADGYDYANGIDFKPVSPQLKYPNITAHYRRTWPWGHIQVGGIVKSIKWKDLSNTAFDLSGSAVGWGFNLSTVINLGDRIKLKLQGVNGAAMENYIADVTPDIGLESNLGNPSKPVIGIPLPVWGFFTFAEIKWAETLQTSVGYSTQTINNSDLQSPDAFRKGQYGLINLRYYPVKNVLMGLEYQYGRRDNYSDGFHSFANKIQLSFKYNFSHLITIK